MGTGKYTIIAPFPIPFVRSCYSLKSQLHYYFLRVAATDTCHSFLASVEARYFCFQNFFEPQKRHYFAKQKYVSQISNWKNQGLCRITSVIYPISSDYIPSLFNLARVGFCGLPSKISLEQKLSLIARLDHTSVIDFRKAICLSFTELDTGLLAHLLN